MKYTRYSVLVFVVFAGIPAFLQEKRSHIIAETISKAWHQPDLERGAARGARMLRAVYETTPEQTIHFSSVVANNDGDICYLGKTTDARHTSELVFAFFEHGAKGVRYNLELTDVQGVCDAPGSHDLTAFVEDTTVGGN